jgi:AcrR family transcriptional regulator
MPRPPIVATRIRPPDDADSYSRLSPVERAFVYKMRKRDRTEIVDALSSALRKGARDEAPLRIQVLQSRLPTSVKQRLFEDLGLSSCEKITAWTKKAVRLPLGVRAPRAPYFSRAAAVAAARQAMDKAVAACEPAKREVLQLVAEEGCGGGRYSLGFEGPPGTGKTHFVRNALAPALRRPFVSIPLGGATDIAFLLGSLYVYEGSKEGALAEALLEAGCDDPVIYFDELDKVSATDKGAELINVLIHLVDPTANAALRDRYFHGVDIDFSRCTFIFSYNDPSRVSPILLDRIRRVEMPPPSEEERRTILIEHILPRARARLPEVPTLSPAAEEAFLAAIGGDPKPEGDVGMRGAEKLAQSLLSAAHLCVVAGERRGGLVGVEREDVLDASGRVAGPFAARVLAQSRRGRCPDAPPSGMYM